MQRQKSRHSKKYYLIIWMTAGILLMSGALGGCGGEKNSPEQSSNDTAKGNRDATAEVLHPEASGEVAYGTDQIAIDASHASDGYVMLNYTGTNEKVKFQIETPEGGSIYLSGDKEWNVYCISADTGKRYLPVDLI